MPVRRRKDNKKWIYRTVVKLKDGTKQRIMGMAEENTKEAAIEAERAHVERVKNSCVQAIQKKEAPVFKDWFYGEADPNNVDLEPNGRFWNEWVLVENKPSERQAKKSIYRNHLGPAFGELRLDAIDSSEVAKFRAALVGKGIKRKSVNNILCVLSKVLRYAADLDVIEKVPKLGLLKHERPEIAFWEFEEYARLLATAREAGAMWFTAVCLAGEAGLRIGEVKALRWENIDLVARTMTISQQIRNGIEGTPKGGRRRVVPMTDTLVSALKSLDVVRTGYVLRNDDGSPVRDGQAANALRRICAKASLVQREWHGLRHTFGTHLALLGANPFRVQAWMGHAQMTETMRYVHVAQAHARPLLPELLSAAGAEADPDQRVLKMLSARSGPMGKYNFPSWALRPFVSRRGTNVAQNSTSQTETEQLRAVT